MLVFFTGPFQKKLSKVLTLEHRPGSPQGFVREDFIFSTLESKKIEERSFVLFSYSRKIWDKLLNFLYLPHGTRKCVYNELNI